MFSNESLINAIIKLTTTGALKWRIFGGIPVTNWKDDVCILCTSDYLALSKFGQEFTKTIPHTPAFNSILEQHLPEAILTAFYTNK